MVLEAKAPVSQTRESLKSKLERKREAFAESGHCYGIENLTLKKQDPLRYERFHSRLLSTVMAAREMARMISCSPAAREMMELAVALFTPEGDAVTFSTGLTLHIPVMGDVVEWMLDNDWETAPGVDEGDHFACNDWHVANIHVPDCYLVTPVYHDGEIVAWAGAVIHNLDVGGAIPGGGMSTLIVDRGMEGIHLTCEKVAIDDKLRRDYEARIEHNTRTPRFWLLDDRARLAANVHVREQVKKAIEEFGLDYFQQASRELIEEGRQYHSMMVKRTLIPGRYRAATFTDVMLGQMTGILPHAKRNHVFHQVLELDIDRTSKMALDFEGIGPEGFHNHNCPLPAVKGALASTLVQTLHYGGNPNDGNLADIELRLPKGSLVNPQNPFAATGMAWLVIQPEFSNFIELLSRALYSRGFVEEVMAGGGDASNWEIGGHDQYGQIFGGTNFEGCAAQSGAGAILDGLDAAWACFNPEQDPGPAEIWELVFPHLYIGRGAVVDSGSPGRCRSGVAFFSTWMWWGTDWIFLTPMGVFNRFHQNNGMYGGYPGLPRWAAHCVETNVKERIEQRLPIPHREGDPRNPDFKRLLEGKVYWGEYMFIPPPLKEYDITYCPYVPGGGGLGDALERDPKSIEQDLNDGFVSQQAADAFYGAKARLDNATGEWHLDPEATAGRRKAIKQERLSRGVPFKEFWQKERQRVQSRDFPDEICKMYDEVKQISPKWWAEYANFWALE